MLNKYIDITMPWALAKDGTKRAPPRCNVSSGGLRIVSVLYRKRYAADGRKDETALGVDAGNRSYQLGASALYGRLPEGTRVEKRGSDLPSYRHRKKSLRSSISDWRRHKAGKAQEKRTGNGTDHDRRFIKVQLKTALVTACENLEGSDKL